VKKIEKNRKFLWFRLANGEGDFIGHYKMRGEELAALNYMLYSRCRGAVYIVALVMGRWFRGQRQG